MIGQYKFFLRNNDTKRHKLFYIRETVNLERLIFPGPENGKTADYKGRKQSFGLIYA
jgi:hypothetical protein